ncbi:hypothetical protein F5X99DRAFT_404150 [Biscogniauxia marginata]|nr:hypothetical protein F5X99DRAFT_404150 [Biscogniauxia marginata]
MDHNWDTDHFNNKDLTQKVLKIHICAYINDENSGDDDGNPPTNHWAVFLQLPGDSSVRLDMVPGYGSDGRTGKIDIASKEYEYTDKAIWMVTFAIAEGVTVRTIVRMINQNQRQKYTFTEEWEGCRYWIYVILADLEAAGIIEEHSSASAWGALSNYYINPTGFQPREVKQGTFRP